MPERDELDRPPTQRATANKSTHNGKISDMVLIHSVKTIKKEEADFLKKFVYFLVLNFQSPTHSDEPQALFFQCFPLYANNSSALSRAIDYA